MYFIFRCRKCGRYLYARANQKTKRCVCGYLNNLKKVVIIKKVENEREAGEVVRKLQGVKSTGFKRL